LVVDLVPGAEIERLPEPSFCDILDRRFRVLALAPFEASAPAKLRVALRALAGDAGQLLGTA
jgi:hypothetical protein